MSREFASPIVNKLTAPALAHALWWRILFAAIATLFISPASCADELKQRWGLVAGYGVSHPGWGDTVERVETIDIAARYEITSERLLGRSWYKNNHSTIIEAPLYYVINPGNGLMFGLSFLSSWTFISSQSIKPFVLVGGGPLYSGANIPGMGSSINGSYQAGIGFRYNFKKRQYTIELRYHHISNGGFAEPNVPLNSSKILVGVSY